MDKIVFSQIDEIIKSLVYNRITLMVIKKIQSSKNVK